MSEIRLNAIQASSPLGFLAGLGVLRLTTEMYGSSPIGLSWSSEEPHFAIISGLPEKGVKGEQTDPGEAVLRALRVGCDQLKDDLSMLAKKHQFDNVTSNKGKEKLSAKEKAIIKAEARPRLRAMMDDAAEIDRARGSSFLGDLFAGLWSDALPDRMEPVTPLNPGGWHVTKLIVNILRALELATPERLEGSIFGGWMFGDHPRSAKVHGEKSDLNANNACPSWVLDPAENLDSAQAGMTAEKVGRIYTVGKPFEAWATALSIVGMSLMPCIPVPGRSGIVNGHPLKGRDDNGGFIRFPIWPQPMGLAECALLLSHPCWSSKETPFDMGLTGLAAVKRASIVTRGKSTGIGLVKNERLRSI